MDNKQRIRELAERILRSPDSPRHGEHFYAIDCEACHAADLLREIIQLTIDPMPEKPNDRLRAENQMLCDLVRRIGAEYRTSGNLSLMTQSTINGVITTSWEDYRKGRPGT